ncbi:hypothetical protein [Sulfurovum sp. NBC37-1]|uniref:hypothetical protein n=1 Tax=Sulfurovum sp. (strain NBC37-1) TaxID=387093 RepID=UPI00015875EF|nr:hypothetical protein [Sulfurovum sp. NBC37-1]BAF71840.1 hypothetical protein SUN_0882 [Sulfurovum sp. NBC37-1]
MEKMVDCRALRILGVSVSILLLWNGVCDYIYGYSSQLSGAAYFSPAVLDVVSTAGGRPHWMVMMAQTAGWLYPIYALSYLPWWVGMRRAGFWLGTVPLLLLAYSLVMIGGIQHAGWAFLSVLEQAKEAVGSSDPLFFNTAQTYITEHFVMGDLTAMIAFNLGAIWHAVALLSGKTIFPRWFVLFSPFGVLTITLVAGAISPAPIAGYFIALFGTWFMLIPLIASTVWVQRHLCRGNKPDNSR